MTEKDTIIRLKDDEGNEYILYPATKAENIIGLKTVAISGSYNDLDNKPVNATTSKSGLMSNTDKSKLDGIAAGANKTVVDTALSSTSTNPVQNKVINTALSGKQPTITGGASTITNSNLTASRALISNSSGKVSASSVTNAELGYLSGVTSNIQTQLDDIQNDKVDYSLYYKNGHWISFDEVLDCLYTIENDYLSTYFVSNGFAGIGEVTEQLLDSRRSATIVVGASDSKYYSDNNYSANYKCTGTADQGQINSAIAALPSSGGKIVLLEGTYNISGSINVNKPNITIEGMGNGTVLKTSSNISAINVSSSNCEIRYLSLICTASDRYGNGIYVTGSSSIIENIRITHFEHNIYLAPGSDYAIVTKCYLYDGEGICVRSKYCIISDNSIENYDYAGIYLYGSSYCNVTGNILKDTGFGIFSQNAETQYNKVSNNYILRGTGTSADYPSGKYSIYITAGTYNYFSDNYIPGKNYVNNAGSTNTFTNNRYS